MFLPNQRRRWHNQWKGVFTAGSRFLCPQKREVSEVDASAEVPNLRPGPLLWVKLLTCGVIMGDPVQSKCPFERKKVG